jgi:hypothetical protein
VAEGIAIVTVLLLLPRVVGASPRLIVGLTLSSVLIKESSSCLKS